MNILFISGVFDNKTKDYIENNNKGYLEYSANNFQINIIKGLVENGHNVKIISAPFCGSWPQSSKIVMFKNNIENGGVIKYAKFFNIWGIRQISRYLSIRKMILQYPGYDCVLVYSAHNPFLKAGLKYKEKNKSLLCNIVPDLPEYMSLKTKKTLIYRFFKQFDISNYYKMSKAFDSFVVLTSQMADRIMRNTKKRPYIVLEGITNELIDNKLPADFGDYIQLSYAGKLDISFGVKKLIEAFQNIKSDKLILNLCGSGELNDYIIKASKSDIRIKYHGFLSYDKVKEILKQSDILINPRSDVSDFSMFSFPSKNIEYMSLSKPVICSKLSGMDDTYNNFIFRLDDNSVENLQKAIERVINSNKNIIDEKINNATAYINQNLYYKNATLRIIDLIKRSNYK